MHLREFLLYMNGTCVLFLGYFAVMSQIAKFLNFLFASSASSINILAVYMYVPYKVAPYKNSAQRMNTGLVKDLY